jgi:hypothetical protein
MNGTPIYSPAFDMEGFRSLIVEACLTVVPDGAPLSVDLRVEGSNDFDAERKSWVEKPPLMPLDPWTFVVGRFTETGRLARLRLDVPEGFPLNRIWIRFSRMD